MILPAVLLIGLAFGLGFSALTLAATGGVADHEQGLAASLFQTSFQVGGAPQIPGPGQLAGRASSPAGPR